MTSGGKRKPLKVERGTRTGGGQRILPSAVSLLKAVVANATAPPHPGQKLRSTLETACQAAGFAPRIVAETRDLGVMVELAEQLGVAVLPASGLEGAAELVRLRLTHPRLDRRILLAWRPAASPPAARAFLALAREHLTPPAGDT